MELSMVPFDFADRAVKLNRIISRAKFRPSRSRNVGVYADPSY